ncbi:polyprenol reductase [Spodoptera frugiperda]|uniref:Polyprenal reductase n=1 Tax=Spodoptera frugiperda TaxID=7108 RepID=A0A9R0F620_SPOFR|nr:polyprenol reductase [Spodoptera frugiperda]
MDDYINIIDFIFLNLAFAVTFTGVIINNFEKYVPAFIIKGYRYGSFAYQGSDANYLQVIEIPKAYYRHFYLFSTIFSASMLSYMFVVYFFGVTVSFPVHFALRMLLQENEPSVSVRAALVALSLLTVQCIRRLYETYYLQVFAKSSKMNLSHYLAGIIHYFACIIAVVGQAPLFCGQQNRDSIKWNDLRTTILAVPCTVIFLITWYEQFQTNIIFANLRKDKKSGEVVTEEHKIPHGRMFEYVSSPHRMCEIILYTVLLMLVPTKTFFCIYLWVLGNQIQTAIQAHEWYKKSFEKYPTNRYAVFPRVL